MAVKNVVFDFGGVMVGYDPARYMKKLYGDKPVGEYILHNLFGSEIVGSLDLGLNTREEAYATVVEKADMDGFGIEMRWVIDHWFDDMMGTKEDTVELVKELKCAGFGVYYLTNMPEDLWAEFTKRGLRDIFMGGVASYEVHVIKPDPRIYEILFDRCGLKPAECVFLDDMERNVQGGRDAGMMGILFSDAKNARSELGKLGITV